MNKLPNSNIDNNSNDDDDLLQSPFDNCKQQQQSSQSTIDDIIDKIENEQLNLNYIDSNFNNNTIDNNTNNEMMIEKFFDSELIYTYCPICEKSSKNINHIRKCSIKFQINVKDLIKNLRTIPKINQVKMKKNSNHQKNKQQQQQQKHQQQQTLLIDDQLKRQQTLEKNIEELKIINNNIFNDNDNGHLMVKSNLWNASSLMKFDQFVLKEFQIFYDELLESK